jgi:hypothetical protein
VTGTLKSASLDRAEELGLVLATIVVDSLFLALTAAVNWILHSVLIPAVHLDGPSSIGFVVLDWAFTLSTVGVVLAFLIRDTWVAIARQFDSTNQSLDSL